jgi:hypothetical protein
MNIYKDIETTDYENQIPFLDNHTLKCTALEKKKKAWTGHVPSQPTSLLSVL